MNLKSKRINDSSINRSISIPNTSASATDPTISDTAKDKMSRLRITDSPAVNRSLLLPNNMFTQSRANDEKARLAFAHMDNLRTNVTQLQLLVAEQNTFIVSGRPLSDDLVERIFAVASDSCWTIRNECQAYDSTHHNRSTKNMFYNYDTDALNACRSRMLSAESVLVDDEMFDGEMLVSGRRVLGCLAAICRHSGKMCETMAVRRFRVEQVTCLEVLADALMAVGYSVSTLLMTIFVIIGKE